MRGFSVVKEVILQLKIPQHLAIIMDGNGRWAKAKGLPRRAGHREGIRAMRETIKGAQDSGIKYLTLYAFSTENWKRPEDEVEYLMSLPQEFLKRYRDEVVRENIRFRQMGRKAELPVKTREAIDELERLTVEKSGLQVLLAFNYGGRAEIIDACKSLSQHLVNTKASAEFITEEAFSNHLYLPDVPDVDLIIRTSGEYRLSNFLLWRGAYAELFFMDVLWPDFRREHLIAALQEYNKRKRRFGGLQAEEAQ